MSPSSRVPGRVAVKSRPIRSGLSTGRCPGWVVRFVRPGLAGTQAEFAHQIDDGALDGVRALPTKRRTSRAAAARAGRWDILVANDVYRRPRRRFTRRVSVRSGRPTDKARGTDPLPLFTHR